MLRMYHDSHGHLLLTGLLVALMTGDYYLPRFHLSYIC